ncbi:MAG TPA: VOC family protein [Candidatus Binataceae bacterium]|nr:VOC family protein [Candidatus Binataceae bacterium]
MEINGVAHVILTVSDFDACRPFYKRLLAFLGLKAVIDADQMLYCVGGRTAIGIMPCAAEHRGEKFVQQRVGLHHVCLRARERAEIDEAYKFLPSIGAKIVHPPEDGAWAPGYYSVLFEDPDGIRIEINHVPGKGLLTP